MKLKIQCMCGCGYTTILEGEFPMVLGIEAYYCKEEEE